MERGLAMAAFADAMERGRDQSSPSSRSSSSGCQSGWTLYLDHSNNNGAARYVPAYDGDTAAASQRWMLLQQADNSDEEQEDSMTSDASSGPRPHPRDEDDDERRRHFVFQPSISYSSTSGLRSSGASGSGSFGSSTSHVGVDVVARTAAAAVFRGQATSRRQYRREVIVIDDDDGVDELGDTASSSGVFSCPMPMLHARCC